MPFVTLIGSGDETAFNAVLRLVFYVLVVLLIVWIIADTLGFQNQPVIPGIPDFPGLPIVGNVFTAMKNPALKYMKWSHKYDAGIFQVRLGNKRVLIVNRYDEVSDIWNRHSCSTGSRPVSYTFHGIVSATQGFTIGSTPAGETYQRKKKTISTQLNKRAVDGLAHVIDEETTYMIKNLISHNHELTGPPSVNFHSNYHSEISDIDMMPYSQLFALRSSIYISYGLHLDCYHRDADFCQEIIKVESQIMRYRSPSANLKDYLVFLRYLPWKGNGPTITRDRRDAYMDHLYNTMKTRSRRGDNVQRSLVSRIENETNSSIKLNPAELKSLCLTMVSAGLDNTPLTFNHLLGHLSQPYGEKFQEKAFQQLLKLNNNHIVTAWETSSTNTDCTYIMALVHEALRFFSVLPLGLPRTTTKDFNYKGVRVPEGTTLVMNAYAANHDESMFKRPYEFLPKRWLDSNGNLLPHAIKIHYAFGAGSRMCSGNHLAIKELYTLTCRMILMFKVKPPTGNFLMELDPFKNNLYGDGTSFEPKMHKVRLEPRVWNDCDKLYYKVMRGDVD